MESRSIILGKLAMLLQIMLVTVSISAVAKTGAGDMLITPVSPACVSSPFGPRHLIASPMPNAFHNGIDLPAAIGQSVLAVAPGSVVRVQRKGPGGLEILIQHDGFIGVYSHLGLVAPAIAGERRKVQRGLRIGIVGRSGVTIGPHLFLGIIIENHFVDPAKLLGVAPCGTAGQAKPSVMIGPDRTDSRQPVATIRSEPVAVR